MERELGPVAFSYEEAQTRIASLAPRGWRLGLDRMQELVRRAGLEGTIGQEAESPRYFHVAGTNGKGSVTANLQSLCCEAGWRTGSFFSPFVYDPRERIQFGRALIEPEAFARLTSWLWPISESLSETEFGGVTEFEFKTALGFAYWREKRCEAVALEVGLGGRLDSTNVVRAVAGAIVSLSLDHTNVLGDSIEAIAFEKAGILKPGMTAVLGSVPPEARQVVERTADEVQATLWRMGKEVRLELDGESWRVCTPARTLRGLMPGLSGAAQPHNLAVAVACLDAGGALVPEESVREGLRLARLPGRFELREARGQTVLLDGAHNHEAARTLAEGLGELGAKRWQAVVGMVQGHAPERFLGPLEPFLEALHLVPVDSPRAYPPEAIREALGSFSVPIRVHESVSEGLEAAFEAEGPVLVTGSFYLLGEAVAAL